MQTVDMSGMKDVVGYRELAIYLGVGEVVMTIVECTAMVTFLIQTVCRYVLKYYKLKEAIRFSPSEIEIRVGDRKAACPGEGGRRTGGDLPAEVGNGKADAEAVEAKAVVEAKGTGADGQARKTGTKADIDTDFHSRAYQINVTPEGGIRRNLLMAPRQAAYIRPRRRTSPSLVPPSLPITELRSGINTGRKDGETTKERNMIHQSNLYVLWSGCFPAKTLRVFFWSWLASPAPLRPRPASRILAYPLTF
jgi:hypothetical protein